MTSQVKSLTGKYELTRRTSVWYTNRKVDLKTYFYGLTPSERRLFAERAGTTARYIQCHLLSRAKIPRPALMQKLASASSNVVTFDDLLRYFYQSYRKAAHGTGSIGERKRTKRRIGS